LPHLIRDHFELLEVDELVDERLVAILGEEQILEVHS